MRVSNGDVQLTFDRPPRDDDDDGKDITPFGPTPGALPSQVVHSTASSEKEPVAPMCPTTNDQTIKVGAVVYCKDKRVTISYIDSKSGLFSVNFANEGKINNIKIGELWTL